ncbi:MAG: hypothetical protein ACRD1Z_19350, partial [Vicinamibacteria bacterium]
MSNHDERKAVRETALPADPPKTGPSDDSLQKFLARWAAGEHDAMPPAPAATPAALSMFVTIETLVGEPPPDLALGEDQPGLPKPLGERQRYQMVGQLGEGGMGEVYLAFDRDLRRQLAIKTVRADSDKPQIWRFLKEAQVLG